jgi:hypothetical protein
MRAIGPEQMKDLLPAEEVQFASPIPMQIVSSDEYLPAPQTAAQREVEARLQGARRFAGRKARRQPATILPNRRRHGRILSGDERGLRPNLHGQQS